MTVERCPLCNELLAWWDQETPTNLPQLRSEDQAAMSFTCPNCGVELGLTLEALSGAAAVEQGSSDAAGVEHIRRNGAAEAQLADMGLVLRSTPIPNPSTKTDPYQDPDFQAFWRIYPLKRGKRKAAQRFVVARRMVPAVTILGAAAAYAREVEGRDPTKIKWAEGWLNDQRWEDEIPDPSEDRTYQHLPVVGTPEFTAWQEAEERKAMDL